MRLLLAIRSRLAQLVVESTMTEAEIAEARELTFTQEVPDCATCFANHPSQGVRLHIVGIVEQV